MIITLILACLLAAAFVPLAISTSRDHTGRAYDCAYTRARSSLGKR